MQYITHHRFKSKALCGKELTLPYGTTLKCEDGKLIKTEEGKAICFNTSYSADQHFSRNEDGNGLRRGALTYAIAFAPRKVKNSGFRFSEEEQKLLCEKWDMFLKPNLDVILFNNAFFHADILTLGEIAKDLNIKIKE